MRHTMNMMNGWAGFPSRAESAAWAAAGFVVGVILIAIANY